MRHLHLHRSAMISAVAIFALTSATSATVAAEDDPAPHAVVGRYSIESEAGGAIWAFQPSGRLIVTGPGDQIARGEWSPASGGDAEFDASLDVKVTGQQLTALGAALPDGSQVALFVRATDATDAERAVPWPEESALIGHRLGLVVESTPEPSAAPIDCERPLWLADGSVDWDRCDLAAAPATPAP